MPPRIPGLPKVELPPNPLTSIRKVIIGGRQQIEKARDGIHSIADDLHGSTTTAPQLDEKVPIEQPLTHKLSNEETVAYQKRELGKQLFAMELHYAQKMRINGIPCDCGSSKHLLGIETFSEETIPMVNNPQVYYDVLEWLKEVSPKSTDAAAKSGKFDEEYLRMSGEARDFRKKIMGTLSPAAMIEPGQHISLDEAKKLAAEEAARRVEERWPNK